MDAIIAVLIVTVVLGIPCAVVLYAMQQACVDELKRYAEELRKK